MQSSFHIQRAAPYSPLWFCRTQFWICFIFQLGCSTHFFAGFATALDRSLSLNPSQSSAWSLSFSSQQVHLTSFPWCQSRGTPLKDRNSTPYSTHSAPETISNHCIFHIWNRPCQRSGAQSLYFNTIDLDKLLVATPWSSWACLSPHSVAGLYLSKTSRQTQLYPHFCLVSYTASWLVSFLWTIWFALVIRWAGCLVNHPPAPQSQWSAASGGAHEYR